MKYVFIVTCEQTEGEFSHTLHVVAENVGEAIKKTEEVNSKLDLDLRYSLEITAMKRLGKVND